MSPAVNRATAIKGTPANVTIAAVGQDTQEILITAMLVAVCEERAEPLFNTFENGSPGALLPLDDKDVTTVISTAVDDQVGPEPSLVTLIPIRSGWQPLFGISVSVVVKIDGEPMSLEFPTESLLQIDPEAVHERKLMNLKAKQLSVSAHDVTERVSYRFQDG
jgi:hypothetical protein